MLAFVLFLLVTGTYGVHCPEKCQCEFNGEHVCILDNKKGNVQLRVIPDTSDRELLIVCGSNDIMCSDFPQLDARVPKMSVFYCPSKVLRCVNGIIEKPEIDYVRLYYMTDNLTSEDVKDYNYVRYLFIQIKDKNSSIPITPINSMPSLDWLMYVGGKLEPSSNNFNSTSIAEIAFLNTEMRILEGGVFSGLPGLLILNITDSYIEEIRAGAFKGLGNLLELIIKDNSIKLLDEKAFEDIPRLKNLWIYGLHLESFPNKILDQLDSLEIIVFGCSHAMSHVELNLDAHTFSNRPALKAVGFTMCKIKELTDDLFSNSSAIIEIQFQDNIIENVSLKLFSNVTNLKKLLFSNNSLHEIPEGFFNNLTSLQHLDLSGNNLQMLEDTIFNHLTSLEKLTLGSNNIHELPKNIFSSLKSLIQLSLSDNNLQQLDERIFSNLNSLQFLNLENNNLRDLGLSIFSNLTSLEILGLGNNSMIHVPQLNQLKNLKILDLSFNKMGVVIPRSLIFATPNLTELYLRNNSIRLIQPNYFSGTSFGHHTKSKLKILDLSGNKLREFYKEWKSEFPDLQYLNLSTNRLTDIQIFDAISSLNITINLEYNSISKVVLDPRLSSSIITVPASSHLLLDHNPINCDCNAFGVISRAKGYRILNEPHYNLSNTRCSSPPNLKGSLLKDVSPMDLICDLPEFRSDYCSQVIAKAVPNEVLLTCAKVPSLLPDLSVELPYTLLAKPMMTLHLDEQPQSIKNLDIFKLNLSNTDIHTISFKPTDSLRVVDLSKNKLTSLPDEFLKSNITFYLAGNPLKCDCSFARKFKTTNHTQLADAALVFCANENKNFTSIDEKEICNRVNTLTSIIGSTVVCGAFLLMILVAIGRYINRNWQRIVSRLCSRNTGNTIKLEEIPVGKPFDLFLSCAPEDEEFVREHLLPKLEDKFDQKVCVFFRDWKFDEPVMDQIVESVNNSRKTVILLSEDYLLSEWWSLAFSQAYNSNQQQNEIKIIIILFEKDILKDERLTKDLKSYIATNSYILWDDPEFWHTFQTWL